jgi:type IV pilus assembly protein PilB
MVGKRIGEILLELGTIKPAALEQAISEQRKTGGSLGEVIIRRGMVSVEELEDILARQHRVPAVNLENCTITPELLQLVPEAYMRKHLLAPVALQDKTLTVAMSSPGDYEVLDELRFMTGKQISPMVTSRTGIRKLFDNLFGDKRGERHAPDEHPVDLDAAAVADSNDLGAAVRSLSTSHLEKALDNLLLTAAALGVSHIHLQSGDGAMRLRFREGDTLSETYEAPAKAGDVLLKKLRALCGLESGRGQIIQGFFDARLGGTHYRLGFNSIPLPSGESAVLTLEYPPLHAAPTLDVLGMYPEVLATYREMINRKSGLILFPAPPGDGKTTTIYATLEELRSPGKRSVTVESPIKRRLEGIEQLDPDQLPGIDAQWLLEALSGQNIDHLMIHDLSTPRALQAALRATRAGALVLGRAAHHDALGFISKIISMGVDPTLLASELRGVVGQRLVNMLCSHCLESEEPSGHMLEELKRLTDRRSPKLYHANGCKRCGQTGKMGKVGIYELFPASELLTKLVMGHASEQRMKEALCATGVRILTDDALLKAADGLVSKEEALAAI